MSWRTAWNWKSAVLSALGRSTVFFSINASAGFDAAATAMQVEFVYRIVASGFYGALTQYFAARRQSTAAGWTALVVLPAISHGVEWLVHSWAGTPILGWSIAGSVAFSFMTTRFHLVAMRRGVLTVGPGSASWTQDLRAMPATVAAFFRPL